MKKLLVFCVAIGFCVAAHAQDRYTYVGFQNTEMRQADFPALKSNFGLFFTMGETYHIWGDVLRLGLDCTWLDVNYSNYKINHKVVFSSSEYNFHQGEVSVQVGPSLTLTPVYNFSLNAYARYAPAISLLYDNEYVYGNYATLLIAGGSLTFGSLGFGAEYRRGYCDYKNFSMSSLPKKMVDLSGWRFYVSCVF